VCFSYDQAYVGDYKCIKRNWNVPFLFKKNLLQKQSLKGGSTQDVDNYHPVALVPALSKILENIILKQFLSFCEKHKILNCFNSG
jgi:hypothetical protein